MAFMNSNIILFGKLCENGLKKLDSVSLFMIKKKKKKVHRLLS